MADHLGDPITLRVGTVTCGFDVDGNWIALDEPGKPRKTIRLPPWRGGVGGMELVASRDERYVALFIYSGQSSQGYEVFALSPTLTRIGGLAEVRGHGDAPVFSPDGDWLVTLIQDPNCSVRGLGEPFETVQDDDSDDLVIVDWATLYVQRLPGAEIEAIPVGVEVPRATSIDSVYEWNAYDAVRFRRKEVVTVRMPRPGVTAPWEDVSLPPRGPITSRGFVD